MMRQVAVGLAVVAIGVGAAATAAAERERIVLLPITKSSALLFSDELDRLQDAARAVVAERFADRGTVLSKADEREIDRLVKARRVVAGGPVCRVSPSREHVTLARYWPYLGAQLDVGCFGGTDCTLHLQLRSPTVSEWLSFDSWDLIAEIIEVVPRAASIDRWIAALRASRPEPESAGDDGGAGLGWGTIGGDRTGGPVAIGRIESSPSWAQPPAASDFSAAELRALKRCAPRESNRFGGDRIEVLVQVSASGKVSRCEAARSQSCLCGKLGKHRFGSGAADRRAQIELVFHVDKRTSGRIDRGSGKRHVSNRGLSTFPSSPDYGEPLLAAGRGFAPCVAGNKATARRIEFEVSFELDPSGRVTGATVAGGDKVFSAGEIACIEGAANKIAFPCPIDDTRTVTGIYAMY